MLLITRIILFPPIILPPPFLLLSLSLLFPPLFLLFIPISSTTRSSLISSHYVVCFYFCFVSHPILFVSFWSSLCFLFLIAPYSLLFLFPNFPSSQSPFSRPFLSRTFYVLTEGTSLFFVSFPHRTPK